MNGQVSNSMVFPHLAIPCCCRPLLGDLGTALLSWAAFDPPMSSQLTSHGQDLVHLATELNLNLQDVFKSKLCTCFYIRVMSFVT